VQSAANKSAINGRRRVSRAAPRAHKLHALGAAALVFRSQALVKAEATSSPEEKKNKTAFIARARELEKMQPAAANGAREI
jgi:hypothetical protein